MEYVDGVVLAVPEANKEQYIKHAEFINPIFREYGALSVVECWGDDIPDGETTSFPLAVKAQEGEMVVFSWIVWPSKEVRDSGMQQMMQDERMEDEAVQMPFDGKRMIMGGFNKIMEF